MAYKVKEEYKDYKPLNMNISYGQLKPHQIKNLSDSVKEKYYTNTTISKKKKSFKNNTEDIKNNEL
ncbi:MAG: hypothetical protein Unbinned6004contig1002_41 [Prokaryotic dsDNA virus sp.]|nr:MAG: hypothetical protein Unbinned6004contig1002_41 [Prokaryotic dsDNA virus sp.]|tara:strand:- start:3844 stop:4041 length:198 start_codon:yes stop_codon:yes gene_type:complete